MKEFGTTFRLAFALGFLSGSTAVWADVQMKSRDGQSRLGKPDEPGQEPYREPLPFDP